MRKTKKLNWIEKNIASPIRMKISTLIITALGLFLALQYNETIKAIFEKLFPLPGEGILIRVLYILALTVVIVITSVAIEKALDGKPN